MAARHGRMERRIKFEVDMKVLKEGKIELYSGESSFLGYIMSGDFAWYYTMSTANYGGMIHTLMHRDDSVLDSSGVLLPGKAPQRGIQNSDHYPAAEQLFLRICGDNNVTVRAVYRASFNRTFHEPHEHSEVHYDHRFPHKVFILYLHAQDGGDTLLFDDDGNHIETIKSDNLKYVIFEGCAHAISYCKPQGTRVVLAITFDGDVNE